MKVIYNGPFGSVTLPDGTECPKGVPVDVSASIGKNLVRQGFTTPREDKN